MDIEIKIGTRVRNVQMSDVFEVLEIDPEKVVLPFNCKGGILVLDEVRGLTYWHAMWQITEAITMGGIEIVEPLLNQLEEACK